MFAGTKTAGYNRWRFLLECLQDLDNQLKNVGGRLFVFRGDPVQVLENLFSVSSQSVSNAITVSCTDQKLIDLKSSGQLFSCDKYS